MRLAISAALLFLGACSDEGPPPTQVWTPADHSQPPEREVDPNRRARPARPRAERSADPRRRAALALWNVSCASCHGRRGAGDGPERPGPVPDFTDPQWQQARSNEAIARAIVQGRGAMPPFGDTIQPQGIAALVDLVRGFGAAAGDATP